MAHVSRSEKKAVLEDRSSQKWWTDDLVLGLGLYTILVIAVKTTLEYCYTCVVAADTRSPEAMVTVTGYLYAAAGVAASEGAAKSGAAAAESSGTTICASGDTAVAVSCGTAVSSSQRRW